MTVASSPLGSGPSSGPEPHLSTSITAAAEDAAAVIERVIEEMSLAEKIGQMTQVDKGSITPAEVAEHAIGSVLSGGGGNPEPNDPATWAGMVSAFVDAATKSRLGIPLLYGVDAVHGHSNVRGATIFPHNIGLGAARDVELVRRIGRATALEMAATGVRWTFAPTVAVPHDIRWGRTYEGYGRDSELVASLGAALVEGLQDDGDGGVAVLACLKHFVGDGGTSWRTVQRPTWVDWWDGWGEEWSIDQGDLEVSEAVLRAVHLPPYAAGIAAGARTVMASYSSWQGEKLHGHRYLLTEVLKGELGFAGFVVSDWMAVDQIDEDYDTSVAAAINAGVDMIMVPFDYARFMTTATRAVTEGRISEARIDEAVRRILRVKASLRLDDKADRPSLDVIGCKDHRLLAAEAARRSAVLLTNDGTLPLQPLPRAVDVAGDAADDIGLQCGGWTIEWQGAAGSITPGTTLLQAMRATLPEVRYSPEGRFQDHEPAAVGVVCVAEEPYAEGPGDRATPTVRNGDRAVFARMRSRCDRLILVVYSGRPLLIPDLIEQADVVVAAWLPGSEAGGLLDLILGGAPFEGSLPQPWPRHVSDLGVSDAEPQFPAGFGLNRPTASGPMAVINE